MFAMVIVICLEVKLALSRCLPSYQGMARQCSLLLLPESLSTSHSCGLIPFSLLFPNSSSFHGVWWQLAELVTLQPSQRRPGVNQGVWWGGIGASLGEYLGEGRRNT